VYESKQYELQQFTNLSLKTQKGLDAYFVKVYPPDHVNRFITEFDTKEWQQAFGRNRKRESKGFIELNF